MVVISRLKEFFSKILNPVKNFIFNGASGLQSKLWSKQRALFLLLVFAAIIIGIFGLPKPSYAMGDLVIRFLSWILSALVSWLGQVLMTLVDILIKFAQFNNFVNSQAVINGWVIVRDLVNMFFIVILLAIAIATILKIEMYHYKKLLGRLIIMAVLINFSKTICGIIIDFAQVLMLTFVNGFKAAAGGNFVEALKINEIMKVKEPQEAGGWELVGAWALALVVVLVSIVVVGVMIIILLIRIVMLWILIVLSPLAFFLSTFPQGEKYASQWWSQFGNYVIVGPVLAFFLWLSLISVTTLAKADMPPGYNDPTSPSVAVTAIGSSEHLIGFIIAIGMLVGGLHITSQMGIMGSSLAGSAVSGMKRVGMAPAKWAGRRAKQAATRVGERAGAFISAKTGGLVELRGSKREERREARHKARIDRREGERMVRAGTMMEKYPRLMAVVGSRIAPEIGLLTHIKSAFGHKESRAKVNMAAQKNRQAGYAKTRSVDPIGGFNQEQKTEGAISSKKQRRAEKKARKLDKRVREDHKELFDQYDASGDKVANLKGQESSLSAESGRLTKERDDYEAGRERVAEIDAERGNVEREMRDTEKQPASKERDERLEVLTKQHEALGKEKGEIEEKLKVIADFQLQGVEQEIKRVEDQMRSLGTGAKADEERAKLDQQRQPLLKQRDDLAKNTFDARSQRLAQKRTNIGNQIAEEQKRREGLGERIVSVQKPVVAARAEAGKYKEQAEKHDANLKMDVDMKIKVTQGLLAKDKENQMFRMLRDLQERARKEGKSIEEVLKGVSDFAKGQAAAAPEAPEPSKT